MAAHYSSLEGLPNLNVALTWIQAEATMIPELGPHIRDALLNQGFQEGEKFIKLPIMDIIVPAFNVNSIVRLGHKVL
jgi:hypothetical protein